MKDKRIVIIGAGMAGLTTALSLQKAGFKPVIYEQASELKETGAGITISPNSTHGLEYLGLRNELLNLADRPESQAIIHYKTGHLLSEKKRGNLPYEKYGANYYQIHRADLHDILLQKVKTNDPNAIKLGVSFLSYETTKTVTTISFSNAETTKCDVLVGADGIRSLVRDVMFEPTIPEFTGNVAYRGLVNTVDLSSDAVTPASGVAIAPKKAFARYLIRKGSLINFVAFVRREGWNEEGWSIPVKHEELMEEFGSWHPRISDLIKAAPKDKIFKWALYDRDPIDEWYTNNVVLVGDAAHPMLPFMGMGAAMGIEDGVVLGRAFCESSEIQQALMRYQNARKDRANSVLLNSRKARARFQSNEPESFEESKHINEESLGLFNYNPGTVII